MKISISGFVFVNDMDTGRKFGTKKNHSTLEIKDVAGSYTLFLKKFADSLKSSCLISDLDSVMSHKKEIVLKFLKPNYEVLVMADDEDQVNIFLKDLRSLSENLILDIGKSFLDHALRSFGHIYDYNIMQTFDPTRLRMIALENCNLPHLPEGIGNLALSSLRLNDSRISMSINGQDLFWDWMTKHNISTSLTVLEMNRMGLNKLPFEIIHLKRLQTLSVIGNDLTHLQHFIGELPELVVLNVDSKYISYLPDNLSDKAYIIDCFKFYLSRFFNFRFTSIKKLNKNVELTSLQNVPKLSDLSVLSLFKNGVKFKRREIPRPLWNSYDFVCRCRICKKLIVFDEKYQKFYLSYTKPTQMDYLRIYCQFFECRPKCISF